MRRINRSSGTHAAVRPAVRALTARLGGSVRPASESSVGESQSALDRRLGAPARASFKVACSRCKAQWRRRCCKSIMLVEQERALES